MDRDEMVVGGAIGAFVLVLVLLLIDVACATTATEAGLVVQKIFSPGKSGVGVGPVINGGSSGGMGMAVVVTSTSDEWLALVQTNTGTYKAEASMKDWMKIKEQDRVMVKHRFGLITKMRWSSRLEEEAE